MLIIAENINVMSKKIGEAMRNKDPKPIQELAYKLAENGVDYLDINLGPARKEGPELMDWIVRIIQKAVDLPLSLDTTNIEAIEAGLRAHKELARKPMINSINARPDRLAALIPMAVKYNACFIGLTISAEGIPRDASERGILAAEILFHAQEAGIDPKDIFFDPIVVPVSSQQRQLRECTEFLSMIPELAPGAQSTSGVSNVSNGCPKHLRSLVNQTYLCMLKNAGLTSAIVDGLDKDILSLAGDSNDWLKIRKLVGKITSRDPIDLETLSEEELQFVKTVKVLNGDILYSDSWLDL